MIGDQSKAVLKELRELKKLVLDMKFPTAGSDEFFVTAIAANGQKVDKVLEELEHL